MSSPILLSNVFSQGVKLSGASKGNSEPEGRAGTSFGAMLPTEKSADPTKPAIEKAGEQVMASSAQTEDPALTETAAIEDPNRQLSADAGTFLPERIPYPSENALCSAVEIHHSPSDNLTSLMADIADQCEDEKSATLPLPPIDIKLDPKDFFTANDPTTTTLGTDPDTTTQEEGLEIAPFLMGGYTPLEAREAQKPFEAPNAIVEMGADPSAILRGNNTEKGIEKEVAAIEPPLGKEAEEAHQAISADIEATRPIQNETPFLADALNAPKVELSNKKSDLYNALLGAQDPNSTLMVNATEKSNPIISPDLSITAPKNAVEILTDGSLTLPTSIENSRWCSDLGDRLTLMVKNSRQDAMFALNPPELGPLKVKLQLEDSQAKVFFETHSALVGDLLQHQP